MNRDWIQKEVTSAEANKLLKNVTKERDMLINSERKNMSFRAAIIEKIEDVKPEYDFVDTQIDILDYNESITSIKHCINKFNIETVVGDSGKTIDEVLVLLPQLTNNLRKYESMLNNEEKSRVGYGGKENFIEYDYINYDLEDVRKAYNDTKAKIEYLQLELDKINSTVKFNVIY